MMPSPSSKEEAKTAMTKTNVSDDVLCAARKRGFSYAQIGMTLNVSPQAIACRIGGDHKWVRRPYRSLSFVKCDFCGRPTAIKPNKLNKYKRHYCSIKCHGLDERRLDRSEICAIINSRLNGETWKEAVKEMHISYQTAQRNIWYLLYWSDFLTDDIIHAIWKPVFDRKTFGIKHLINKTGLNPQSGKKFTTLLRWMRS